MYVILILLVPYEKRTHIYKFVALTQCKLLLLKTTRENEIVNTLQ